MRTSSRAVLTFTVAVLTVACSGTEAASSRLAAQRDTVDGVPRLLYPGSGGPALAWRLDTLAVIGDIMGDDPDYQFDQVPRGGIAGDTNGNVWLLDGAGNRLIGYSPDGTYLNSFGRQGSGPGEINMAGGITAGRGDTIWVAEAMSGRLTGFPAAGGEPRIITFDANTAAAPPIVMHDDQLIAGMRFTFGIGGPSPAEQENRAVIARFSLEGALRDTLFSTMLPKPDVVQIESGNRRMMMLSTPRFAPVLRWAAFSDGSLAIVTDDRYAISILNPDGSERLRVERDAPPRATTDADRAAVLDEMRNQQVSAFGADRAMQDEMLKRRIEATTFAPTVPRIDGLAVDEHDRLWVHASSDEPAGDGRIDLYDRTGEFLGSLPGIGMPTALMRNGLAAYLDQDEDTDVQQVTVMRLLEE